MKIWLLWSVIGVQVLQAAQQDDDHLVRRKRFGSLDSLVSSDSSSHSSSADESGPELCKKSACLSTMRKSFVRAERPYVEHNQDAQGDPLTQERTVWHEAKLEDSAECLKEQFQDILWHSLSTDIKKGSDQQDQDAQGDPLVQELKIWDEATSEDCVDCFKQQFRGILWHSLSTDVKNSSDQQALQAWQEDHHVGLMRYLREKGDGHITLTLSAIELLKKFLQQSPGIKKKRALWLTYAFSVGIDDASINAVLEQR